jgi:hypothetical protein
MHVDAVNLPEAFDGRRRILPCGFGPNVARFLLE